jgi:hypothetical protein
MHQHERETIGFDEFGDRTTVTLDPDTMWHLRVMAWTEAVRTMERAINRRTGTAWRAAARAWDALAELHTPTERDRRIYADLAKQCRKSV